MKWALVMYFFYFGPWGGWEETDRRYYPDYQSCIEAHETFKKNNPFDHIATRIRVKCQEVED